jgi:hypothetical protein
MKWAALAVLMLTALAGEARAQDKFMCCDLDADAASAPCTASMATCARSGDFSVMLSDLPNSDAAWAPGADATIPAGQDGYLYWSASAPHLGFCLVAPVPSDAYHDENPYVDPIGCLRVTLNPGVSAEQLDVMVPSDPRWDGYEWCYGAPDPVNGCQTVADGLEMNVSMTPSGSCCGPATRFLQTTSTGKMEFAIDQYIPGVSPPTLVIQQTPDGGVIVPYFSSDPPDADVIISSADAGCLGAYGESKTCGSPPDGSPAPGAIPGPSKVDAGSRTVAAAAAPHVGCSFAGGYPGAPAAILLFVALRRARRRVRAAGLAPAEPASLGRDTSQAPKAGDLT